jgi:hypothetical protein
MNLSRPGLAAAIALAALCGCASTTQYGTVPPEELAGRAQASVKIVRAFGPGSALQAPIYVNNNLIGKIGVGGELRTPVPAGTVRVRSTANTVTIQAIPGAEYSFDVAIDGMWIAEPDWIVRSLGQTGPSSTADAPLAQQSYPREPTAVIATRPPTGDWSYAAERVARNEKCAADPRPTLTAKGSGFETYLVQCFSGDVLNVRCEFGQCKALR